MIRGCEHLREVEARNVAVRPSSLGCAECLAGGGQWVHLRLCLTCGHVGCCDDSPNRHAWAHFGQTGHPVVKSFEPGERWAWCYADGRGIARITAYPEEMPKRHLTPPP